MKKFLSIMLAILMIVTTMPMSFAVEETPDFSDAKILTKNSDGILCVDGVEVKHEERPGEGIWYDQYLPSGKYKLTGDIEMPRYGFIYIEEGSDVTVDLNGCTWELHDAVYDDGKLSVYDTSADGTGKITTEGTIFARYTHGELNLYSGTVEPVYSRHVFSVVYGSTINLYGGKVKSSGNTIKYGLDAPNRINLYGTVLECGDGYAHFVTYLDTGYTAQAVINVADYTGEGLTVDADINSVGKMKFFEGIKNAEEAENYKVNFSSSYSVCVLEKTEYDEATGEMFVYVAGNGFTQQPSAENDYTVDFNTPDADFKWYEAEKTVLTPENTTASVYATFENGKWLHTDYEFFKVSVQAGDIIRIYTSSDSSYLLDVCAEDYSVYEHITFTKTGNITIDADAEVTVSIASNGEWIDSAEFEFELIRTSETKETETEKKLQNPECEKTYVCKATVADNFYLSDLVTVTHSPDENGYNVTADSHSYTCSCGESINEAHTVDITTGKCGICDTDMTVVATVTDSTNTYYAADAATLNQAVTAILETGSRTFTVELPADTEAEMITAIRRAICDTEGVADGSINLTLKGVTSIPGTTNWDGVAFGPRNAQWDENNVEIVSHEEVTQLASVNLPDATEIGAQAFYFCENLVTVSAPKAQTIGAQAFGYTALTSVEFPELTTIPTDMFSGTWTLSSAKFPKVTTIEQGGLLVGAKFNPENNPTPFPLELTAEGDITFIGSNHFNIASQNYSGKVDLVLCCDKADKVTKNEDGTGTWQVRDDLSYTFKSITFKHSYTDGVCDNCEYACPHENETGDTCSVCGTTIKFATITGVSINVDGVVYTSDNTSAENPAVINPDSVVTVTVTGENFDLLPAGPENAVIGFTYFSQNLEWLYNNPSKYDIDTVNNTVSFPANYTVLPQATTASELTYTNDGWNTDIGSGVYVIYIDKKDIADTLITLDNTEFIYSGNAIEPTVLVMADGQVLMAGEHYTLTFESNVNAGTASVTVKGIGDYAGEVTKVFTITKAYYNLTAPTPNTLTYNGEEQYLVAAGTVEGADFEYSLDGVRWSTSIPLAKDVCNYTVYYRVLADENHYDVEGTVDVTIKECTHEWNEGVLTRPVYDAVLGSKDGYYTYTCTLCGEEKTETVKSADYSAYEAASEEINALLQSDELIPEAKQAIYSAANECGLLSNDLTESEQSIVDDLVAELEKIVDTAEEKIASGEYVKIDGMKEYNKIADALDAELMENYSQEEIAALAEKAGDEINARFGEIIEKAEALTGTVAENKDALAEIESELSALYAEMKNCLDGVHNGLVYEVTEEAKCEVNAIESATCTLCGETDEREIEGTALEHEPNEQMCKGYWCSRCRSFYGEGNPDIHLDGYSSTGKIKDGQCDGCNKQLAFIKSGETYEINSYAYVVEFAPFVDGRYILTVDGPEGTEIDVREVVDGVNKGINCEVISDLVYVVDCTVGKTYRFEASNYYGYNISSMTLECETHKGTVQTCYGYICDACGEYFGEVPGHDIIIDEAVPPTCTQTGLTEGQHCSRCDDMTIIQEKVPATNHKDTLVKVDAKAATCTEAGWEAYEYCTACDYTTYEEIPALKHSFTKYEVTEEAECGKAGKEVAYCDHGCQTTDEREIPALKHSFTKYEVAEEAECGKTGKEVAYCDHGCGATDENEIPALKHEPLAAVVENEVAAECEKAGGYDLVVYCNLCGEELDRDTVTVDALTHTDEDGDYLCDHGCGHEFEKPVEPTPDVPDTPDEPADETCDHLCHKDGILGFLWKIISFFFRLFNIQQYCDCGVFHYDAPIFG